MIYASGILDNQQQLLFQQPVYIHFKENLAEAAP